MTPRLSILVGRWLDRKIWHSMPCVAEMLNVNTEPPPELIQEQNRRSQQTREMIRLINHRVWEIVDGR
jgi:hypothetical protein